MSEVRAEAKESRRERRLQQDKLATTRFDTGVRNHRNLSQTLRIDKVGLYLLLKRRTVTVVVGVPYMTNQNSRKTQLI